MFSGFPRRTERGLRKGDGTPHATRHFPTPPTPLPAVRSARSGGAKPWRVKGGGTQQEMGLGKGRFIIIIF